MVICGRIIRGFSCRTFAVTSATALLFFFAFLTFKMFEPPLQRSLREDGKQQQAAIWKKLIKYLRDSDIDDLDRQKIGEPKPFKLTNLKIADKFCPVLLGLTDGRVKSSLLLTYSFKNRGASSWESVRAITRANSIAQLRFPIIFVGESLGTDDGRYLRGLICLSNGEVGMGFLPTASWPIIYKNDNTIEIHFSDNDSRFPWSNEIESIRVQLLDAGAGPEKGTSLRGT
jgi:hypothetical protein